MSYAVAGAVAVVLAAIEQYNSLQSRFTLKHWAAVYWLLRLALEGGVGVAAVSIAPVIHGPFAHQPVAWILAGCAGPAVVRSRVIDIGRGEETRPAGFATFYDPVRDWLARRIDDVGATRDSRWINEEVLPAIAGRMSAADIADRLRDYIRQSGQFEGVRLLHELDSIAKELDSSDTESQKQAWLVRRAMDLQAYGVVRDIRQACRPAPSGPGLLGGPMTDTWGRPHHPRN